MTVPNNMNDFDLGAFGPDQDTIVRDARVYHDGYGCDNLAPDKTVTSDETRIYCKNCRVVVARL